MYVSEALTLCHLLHCYIQVGLDDPFWLEELPVKHGDVPLLC